MEDGAYYSDDIDVRHLLTGLLRRKKTIFIGVSICISLALLISFLFPTRYSSEGYYSMALSTPKYKNYTGLYEDVNMLNLFMAKYYPEETWVINSSIFKDAFEPIYSYGKNPKNLQKENKVIGIKISVKGASPEIAKERVEALGKYITTNIVNLHIWNHFGPMRKQVDAASLKHQEDILTIKSDILYYEEKIKLIENDLLQFNKAVEIRERQVVQVDEATAKYLPPQQQLIALNISVSNSLGRMKDHKVSMKKNDVMMGFVDGMEGLFENKSEFIIDQMLLQKIIDVKKNFFKSLGEEDYVKSASIALEERFLELTLSKNSSYRFVSGPLLPTAPDGPAKWMIVLGTLILSLFVMIIYSFFLSWWETGDTQ